jgi:hypothetical protein
VLDADQDAEEGPVDGDVQDAESPLDADEDSVEDGGAPRCLTDEDCPRLECHRRVCEDGVCGLEPDAALDGTPCEDGDLCTAGEVCAIGSCVGGVMLSCSFCPEGDAPAFFRSFPSQGIRYPNSVIGTGEGDLAFTGFGEGGVWYVRLTSDGDVLVDRTYGNPRYGDKGYALVELGSEVLLAGYSQVVRPQLAWVVRVGATGEPTESRAYFETENGSFHGVVDLGSEGLLLLANAGGQATLLRVDAAGEPLWERRYFDVASAYALAGLVAMSDGTFAFGGDVGSFPDVDARVVRVRADGEVVWERSYGGTSVDSIRSIVALDEGGLAFAGRSTAPVERGSAWLVRLDPAGDVVWEHGYGDEINASFSSLALDGDGLLAAGSTPGDAWVVRVDPTGSIVEEARLSLGGVEAANCVMPLEDGGFVLGGEHHDPRPRPGFAPTQGWILRVASMADGSCAD